MEALGSALQKSAPKPRTKVCMFEKTLKHRFLSAQSGQDNQHLLFAEGGNFGVIGVVKKNWGV